MLLETFLYPICTSRRTFLCATSKIQLENCHFFPSWVRFLTKYRSNCTQNHPKPQNYDSLYYQRHFGTPNMHHAKHLDMLQAQLSWKIAIFSNQVSILTQYGSKCTPDHPKTKKYESLCYQGHFGTLYMVLGMTCCLTATNSKGWPHCVCMHFDPIADFQSPISPFGRGLPPIYHKRKKQPNNMKFHAIYKNLAAYPDQKKFQCFKHKLVPYFDDFSGENAILSP